MYGNSALFVRPVVSNIRCYKNSTKKLLEFLADMPKANSARIVEAHRQRQQISKKSEMYGPSTVYLQVLGSGAMGASNTLYLFTDHKRYLFNCGEGIQRLAHEHKVKLSRVDHIFITSKTWRNIGGLPGLSLTLQDVGVPNITLHGPEGLDELYNATRRFVTMKDMHVTMAKCSPNEDFEDNVMSVKYVLLGPHDDLLVKDPKPAAKKLKLDTTIEKEFEEFIHDDTDYYKSEKQNVDNNKKHNKDKPKQKINIDKDPLKKKTEKVLHELQKKTHCSVAYICTLKKRLGTLSLEKCVEHGVKPGPLLGQLKNGHDVVLPDGTLVLAKDVKTPDDPGPVFIVLDVPELSYLKEGEFSAHFDNGTNPPENIPTLIVHYTPPQVFNHPTYRSFLMMFGPTTRHLIVNSQNSCLGSEAVHRTQHKLHLLDPDIFPLLRDASIQAVWNVHPPVPKTNSPVRLKGLEELKNKIALAQFQNIINIGGSAKGDCIHTTSQGLEDAESSMKLELIAGRTLTMFHLRPKKQLDRSAEPKLHVQDYIQETMDVDGFVGSLEQFRRLVDSMRYAKSDSCEYPKVVFLGTGSCIPSKTRNTSAIVLQINENCSMLLDCGEGTFCQLVRFYGPKRVNPFLRTLKAIYVSHLHADHHIGLIGLLQARRMAFHESSSTNVSYDPVYLLAPGQIVTWLSTYDQQFERIRGDFTLIPNQSLIEDPSSMEHTDMTSAVLASIGVQDIRTCLVSHCPNAFGVAITIDEMQKITYSGDTIPCDELVNIGKNSTLLIHEATMEDELADEARIKMHSTTSQAIEVGRRMNARYTLLTHFSQRYARLPRLNAHILNDNNSVGIAFDNMQITMSDLELLPHMYAPLQLMFAEHCVEMELKAAQRAKQKERRLSSPNMPSADATSHQTKGTKSDSRKRLPASCQYSSVPATVPRAHAKYRESNASRLRQEMRGMTVTGIVRRSIRSKSSSPAKVSTQCYGSKSAQNSGNTTPGITEKCMDLISTPRSSSETFSLNKKAQERHHSAVCIVDSRSKTINTASRSSDVDSAPDQNKKRQTNVYSALTDANSNGYGKPLVTPMNKKLFIRRDVPRNLCRPVNSEKVSPIVSRTRSPIRSWKAENRESSPQVTATQRNISNKPTKGTIPGNKFRGSNTSTNIKPKPESKIPVKKESTLTKPLRPSSSPLCRRSKSPAWQSSSLDSNAPDTKSNISNIRKQNLYQRDVKSWSPDSNGSSTRRLERKLSLKNKSDKLNNKPVLPAGIHRNTSFKPELEDIKSSYLLLNKKVNQHNMKARLNNEKNLILPSVSKPKPVNETNRQQQLMEAKKKYQSKQFWNDARYDKIEGLNWISWK